MSGVVIVVGRVDVGVVTTGVVSEEAGEAGGADGGETGGAMGEDATLDATPIPHASSMPKRVAASAESKDCIQLAQVSIDAAPA
jgi:hypothetical protein